MAIETNAGIQNGEYGVWVPTKTGSKFVSHGRATYLGNVCEDIETGQLFYHLWCEYNGKEISEFVPRGELSEYAVMKHLSNKGFQVSRKSFDDFVDVIHLQEEKLLASNTSIEKIYFHLGWIELPNDNGGVDLCYRADELIGRQKGEYVGNYYVTPMGSYDVWKK